MRRGRPTRVHSIHDPAPSTQPCQRASGKSIKFTESPPTTASASAPDRPRLDVARFIGGRRTIAGGSSGIESPTAPVPRPRASVRRISPFSITTRPPRPVEFNRHSCRVRTPLRASLRRPLGIDIDHGASSSVAAGWAPPPGSPREAPPPRSHPRSTVSGALCKFSTSRLSAPGGAFAPSAAHAAYARIGERGGGEGGVVADPSPPITPPRPPPPPPWPLPLPLAFLSLSSSSLSSGSSTRTRTTRGPISRLHSRATQKSGLAPRGGLL